MAVVLEHRHLPQRVHLGQWRLLVRATGEIHRHPFQFNVGQRREQAHLVAVAGSFQVVQFHCASPSTS